MKTMMMPKDMKPGDYFLHDIPGSSWLKVNHVQRFKNDGSVVVWVADGDDGSEDVCPFLENEGPYLTRRVEN